MLNGSVGSNVPAIRSFQHMKQTTSNKNSGFGISAMQCVDSVTRISIIVKECIILRWEGITVRRAPKKLHPAFYTPKYWRNVNKHLDPTHVRSIVTARGPLIEQHTIV